MLTFLKRNLKAHWILLGIILVALYLSSLFLYLYATYQNQIIRTSEAQTKANTLKVNNEVERIKTAKAIKLKATKDAADLKIAQDKASQQAAAAGLIVPDIPCNYSLTHADPSSIDVLVNKKHCLRPISYTPTDLVNIHGALLSQKAAPSFDLMYQAAIAARQGFSVTSSYRSYYSQVSTYNYWISVSGKAGADTYSARAGYSEHQTGFAVDLTAGSCSLSCFGNTTQYQWLKANAADYGFVQRYIEGFQPITGYTSEEWHYRYVGVDVAKDMQIHNIATLEQYWGLGGGDY